VRVVGREEWRRGCVVEGIEKEREIGSGIGRRRRGEREVEVEVENREMGGDEHGERARSSGRGDRWKVEVEGRGRV
jgi:hypothetical protein